VRPEIDAKNSAICRLPDGVSVYTNLEEISPFERSAFQFSAFSLLNPSTLLKQPNVECFES